METSRQPSMSELQFETPENVAIEYAPAGLGTRFVAWFIDQIFSTLLTLFIILVILCSGASFSAMESLVRDLERGGRPESFMIIFGLALLLWGLGGFVYFGCCELFLRGQTPGKRMSKIRVVKVDGFSLDAGAIFVRNIFRVLDHMPPLWLVPLLSTKSQRPGDMVAGTVVVSDEQLEVSSVRVELSARSALESEFRFDAGSLSKLTETDFQAVQTLLERWHALPGGQRGNLAASIVSSITRKLNIDPPDQSKQRQFLEDLLAAELRRQHRGLG